MHVKVKIPEFEAALDQVRQKRWTDEVDQAIRDYYRVFADKRNVKALADTINKKYNKQYTVNAVTKRYFFLRDRVDA